MNENAELLRSKIFILRSLVWNYFLKFQTFQQMVFFFFFFFKKKTIPIHSFQKCFKREQKYQMNVMNHFKI